jgi:hypothetical protein
MIIYDHPQGSAEWLASRAGVITASKFVEARKRLKSGPKKGGFTEAAEDYAFRVAVERIVLIPLSSGLVFRPKVEMGNQESFSLNPFIFRAGVQANGPGFVGAVPES